MLVRLLQAFSCCLVLAVVGCQHAPVQSTSGARTAPAQVDCKREEAASEAAWRRFRTDFPFHIQGIALSEPFAGGCRALIIAEPPPHVSVEGLKRVAPEVLSSPRVEQHRLGYDGWTKDVIVTLPSLSEAALSSLLSEIHLFLFQTTYKATVIDWPRKAAADGKSTFPLDLRITASELRRWMVQEDSLFTPVEGGGHISFRQLLVDGSRGVYFSVRPGLVALALPRSVPLDEFAVELRQFSLDSDLIVGAFASDDTCLILGRERVVPTEVLPPMRVETLLLLASVQEDEVQQSFERDNFFAGRMKNLRDWAPAYLSPALVDTEFGSLLGITDQLLKSWSNNGQTHYENFDHPHPSRWAFDKPLYQNVRGGSLTYNWNTKRFGAAFDFGSYELMSFQRTGALPISYFADDTKTADYELKAQDFFATTHSPFLARVVQYTSMYQAFKQFGLEANAPVNSLPDPRQEQVLQAAATELFSRVDALEPTRIDGISQRLINVLEADEPPLAEEKREVITQQVQLHLLLLNMLVQRLEEEGTLERQALIQDLAHRQGGEQRFALLLSALSQSDKELGWSWSPEMWRLMLAQLLDLEEMKEQYARASSARAGTWIHTPAVVVSWNDGNSLTAAVGGHNIDSRVLRFRVSDEAPRGQLLQDKDSRGLVLLHQSSDFEKISAVTSGRSSEIPVHRSLHQALARPEAPVAQSGPMSRGLTRQLEGAARSQPSMGWRAAERAVTPRELEQLRPLAELGAPMLQVERQGGMYRIVSLESSQAVEAWTQPDAVDFVMRVLRRQPEGTEPMQVHLVGFTQGEARGFIHSSEIRAKAVKSKRDLVGFHWEKSAREPRLLVQELKGSFQLREAVIHQETLTPTSHTFQVAFHAAEASRAPVRVRINIFFKQTLPEYLRARLRSVVNRVLKALGRDVDMGDVGLQLRKELKTTLEEIGEGEVDIEMEMSDVHIVLRTGKEPRQVHEREAGHSG